MASDTVGVQPRRLALRFRPPAIIVEYERAPGRQLFLHEVDLSASLARGPQDVRSVVDEIAEAHAAVLSRSKVSVRQLERLVARLMEQCSPAAATTAPQLPQADYNRVSEAQLKQVKQKMDVVFDRNIVRPGEQGFQYDKRVAFQPAQEASDWDDE